MLKLLIINTVSFGCNGITNVILNYYRAMDKSDIQIDFVIPNEPSESLRAEIETCGGKIFVIPRKLENLLSYLRILKKIIKVGQYDLVHAHGNSCTLALEMNAAKKGGAKIRIAHCHNTTCEHKMLNKLLRLTFNKGYTHGFACGVAAGKWLFQDKLFTVINNGIDVEKFGFNSAVRENYRQKYRFEGKKVVGHIGHFTHQKNHEYLIDIFEQLYKNDDSYRLLLLGDGSLRPSIEERVKVLELSDMVTFTGNTLEIPQLMQAMDMIVMPSRFEGLPLTLVEAQAACLPCFVADTVSEEVKMTDLVSFIPIESSPEEWAKQISSLELSTRANIKDRVSGELTNAGYSIKTNAEELRRLYIEFAIKMEV